MNPFKMNVCGDCCYHHGCYEHDVCCQDFFSSACLGPLRLVLHFSCSGYIQTVEIHLLLQKAAVVVVFLLKQLSNERTRKQRC